MMFILFDLRQRLHDSRSGSRDLKAEQDSMTERLVLKLVTFRHGYKVSRATQNLVFKRRAVEGVRRDERGLLAGRDVLCAQRLHVVKFG
jgi:hypothetical protein